MINAYNSSRHPFLADGTVQGGSAEVLAEFADTLQDLIAFRRGRRSYPTNLVAWEEFEDYYCTINGCFESDHQFCSIMEKVWDIDKAPNAEIEGKAALAAPAAGIPAKSRVGLHHWQTNTLPENNTYRNVHIVVDLDMVMLKLRRAI